MHTSWIQAATGATRVERAERIQSLWSGYGELYRVRLFGAAQPTAVVKFVRPGPGPAGPAARRGHIRKLRSYDVELTWYEHFASRCTAECRVPRALALHRAGDHRLFLLEDLDRAGFAGRSRSARARDASLRWLANFHATFMGQAPTGLWPVGSYWHLDTRPDELQQMPAGPLKSAARALDRRLNAGRWQTLVHGDAKPDNFCVAPGEDAVAAVDFQYVGGGCGMRDVAYLLGATVPPSRAARDAPRHLATYFSALQGALARRGVDSGPIESEWRGLFPIAWADFNRFMAGWGGGGGSSLDALTRHALACL